jgi:integrase
MTKRSHGTGSFKEDKKAGQTRIRYYVDGKRYSETFAGNKKEAEARLRTLLGAADKGEHIAPDKQTVKGWIEHWLKIGAPGRRRNKVSGRTLERYSQLLHTHVVQVLGDSRLQKLTAPRISELYASITGSIAPRTLLRAERDKFLRLKAGLPQDGPPVDLSLLKLPQDALIFPSFGRPPLRL